MMSDGVKVGEAMRPKVESWQDRYVKCAGVFPSYILFYVICNVLVYSIWK